MNTQNPPKGWIVTLCIGLFIFGVVLASVGLLAAAKA